MKKLLSLTGNSLGLLCLLAASLFFPAEIQAEEGYSVPEGFMTWNIAAGTGTVKKITALSVPFLSPGSVEGRMVGAISYVTASTLTDLSADWTEGQLSQPAAPHLLKITSGTAAGRTFLISTASPNTATELALDAKDAAQVNLKTLGVEEGDGYEIFECPTLLGLFGTPSSGGIEGGASVANADSLMISSNGQLETYFFNTTSNRWTKAVLGSPDATHTPLRPDTGIFYSRLAASDLVKIVYGRVSATQRAAAVKNSGTTLLAQNWPLASTLLETKIHLIPGWTANGSAATADRVKIVTAGSTIAYWFDGSNWRRQVAGSPLADHDSIPAGSAVILEQLGNQPGYGTLSQPLPYLLE